MKKILFIVCFCFSLESFSMKEDVQNTDRFFAFLIKEIAQELPGLATVFKELEGVVDSDGLINFMYNNLYKKNDSENLLSLEE